MDEQSQRIALTGLVIGLLPFIRWAICHYLGDCYHSKRSARYALGKTFGRFLSYLRSLRAGSQAK